MPQRSDDAHVASDPFASVFQALRSSLKAQDARSGPAYANGNDTTKLHSAVAPAPLNTWPRDNGCCKAYHRSLSSSSPADAFLGILSQRDPNVRAALLQQIQHGSNSSSYSTTRIHELRLRRMQLRRRKQMRIQELQQQQQAIAHDCDHVVHQAKVSATRYAHFARQSDVRANERLQTLLFECIAEMKKALDRIDGVAIESTDEFESMAHERTRQFEWDVFLARLRQDLNGLVRFSQLYPLRVSSDDNNNSSTVRTRANSSSSDADIKAKMRKLLVRNGPVLETEQTLHIQRVIAVLPSKSNGSSQSSVSVADITGSKGKPSLHFGDSGSSTWTDIVRSMLQSATPVPATTSRRSHRRLPPSKSLSTIAATFSTNTDGQSSEIRQLATKTTLQFPRTECDVPLSSTVINWLLRTNQRCMAPGDDGADEYGWMQTIDSSIYFDLEEYEHNLTKAMSQGQAPASTDTHFVVDKVVFASARRSLHEVNVILEHAKKSGLHQEYRQSSSSAPSQMHQLLFARRHQKHVDASTSEGQQRRRESVFVRASVLQLLQTVYYSEQFLPDFSPSDVVFLKQLYPTSLFGADILSNLYVPYFDVDADADANPAAEPEIVVPTSSNRVIVMQALDEKAIHELLLVYIARGRRQDPAETADQLTSLARSDSISALLPSRLGVHDDKDGDDEGGLTTSTKLSSVVHQCTIKNPGSLWNQGRALNRIGSVVSSESTELQAINSADYLYVEYFLSAEETEQYLLSPNELKSCIATLECSGSKAEAVKRIIQQSSSLLDELASRQLATSIGTFFEHVKGSFSNQAFEKLALTGGGMSHFNANQNLEERRDKHNQTQRVEELEAFADEMEQILTLEQSSTKEFQRLIQLTVYPGVDTSSIRKAYLELKEFDADIRTKDLELIFRLSSRKLQLLRRRREDEEARVTLRLAQSHSSSTISAYSAASSTQLSSGSTITTLTTQDHMGFSSPVYDVVHVLRKGRKSLIQQQQQRQRLSQNQSYRPQSTSSCGSSTNTSGLIDKSSLSRSVSEILHQAHQFELKHPVKRGSGAPSTKKLPVKPYRR